MIPYWNSVAAGSNFEDETGTLVGTLLILLALLLSCSCKPAQTSLPPPEVLVTTSRSGA